MSEKIKKKQYWLKENSKYQVILLKALFQSLFQSMRRTYLFSEKRVTNGKLLQLLRGSTWEPRCHVNLKIENYKCHFFRFKKGNWAEAFIELGTSIDIYYNDEALTNPFEEPLEK